MTDRQEAVLAFIERFLNQHRYPPSLREIGTAVGLASTSSSSHQVNRLEQLGYLRRDPHRPRCYTLTERATAEKYLLGDACPEPETDSDTTALVPLVGSIAAGAPILAEEHVEEVLPLPRQLVGNGPLFALHVIGDSMIGAHINDGDTVVLKKADAADSGTIVAALIDGEATVKRLKVDQAGAWLMPENPKYQPFSAREARILGTVVLVLRKV